MEKELYEIIRKYVQSVQCACVIMRRGLELSEFNDLKRYWIKNGQIGEFVIGKRKYTFFFHGCGCRLTVDGRSLDWEFGMDEGQCRIDPWKLWRYICDFYGEEERKYTEEVIKRSFEDAVAQGRTRKIGSFFCVDDFGVFNSEESENN